MEVESIGVEQDELDFILDTLNENPVDNFDEFIREDINQVFSDGVKQEQPYQVENGLQELPYRSPPNSHGSPVSPITAKQLTYSEQSDIQEVQIQYSNSSPRNSHTTQVKLVQDGNNIYIGKKVKMARLYSKMETMIMMLCSRNVASLTKFLIIFTN